MLLRIPLIYHLVRRNVSALYGDRTKGNYPILRPYFDFNTKLHDKQKLEQNITRRKLNIDLNKINKLWSTYAALSKKQYDLERRPKEIVDSMKNVDPKAKGSDDLTRKYEIELAMVKSDLKALKESAHAVEDLFIHTFLDLPNDINERTPLDVNRVHFSHSDQQTITEDDTENHLNKVNYLEYHDPHCYFLKGDAAEYDLALPFYCMEMFGSHGFIPFSNPDFIRSVLAEGAGVDKSDLMTIVDEDLDNKLNLMHIAGGGSMLSFLGFVTRLMVYKNLLPLKFVSSGKVFSNRDTSSSEDYGLYSACQTTNVQLFCMTTNGSEALNQFDEIVGQMIEFYKRLDRMFRVVYVTGDQLDQAEDSRAVFEIFSHQRKCFIPVGHLSSYGDYVSKRLLIAFKDGNAKEMQFPHLISGSLINVTKYLAILLEDKGALKTPKM
ncbi:serine--tRNA synthetase-like protein Slimp [Bradysia coprophila]|uniref:serine--tRNA synthetase-like protein Slimp n=1 Tax=Bradysia coprophila TaxID=38358 RepID=UPI00187DAC8A|nr:serine--tRNA synthetase-like protein Slimp [Bradysia coprophila]